MRVKVAASKTSSQHALWLHKFCVQHGRINLFFCGTVCLVNQLVLAESLLILMYHLVLLVPMLKRSQKHTSGTCWITLREQFQVSGACRFWFWYCRRKRPINSNVAFPVSHCSLIDKVNQVQLSEVKQSKASCFRGIVINGNITILPWERVSSGRGPVPLLWHCRICGEALEKTIDSRVLNAWYIFSFFLDLSHSHGYNPPIAFPLILLLAVSLSLVVGVWSGGFSEPLCSVSYTEPESLDQQGMSQLYLVFVSLLLGHHIKPCFLPCCAFFCFHSYFHWGHVSLCVPATSNTVDSDSHFLCSIALLSPHGKTSVS